MSSFSDELLPAPSLNVPSSCVCVCVCVCVYVCMCLSGVGIVGVEVESRPTQSSASSGCEYSFENYFLTDTIPINRAGSLHR